VLDKIADEKGLKVVKVNVDEEPDLAMQHNVQSLPTMIVFEDGEAVARAVGAMPKPALESALAL
jgi:thioredoxin 1